MSKRVVFVRDDAGRADRAADLFAAVCKRMGLPWAAEVSAVAAGGHVVSFVPLPGAEAWPADDLPSIAQMAARTTDDMTLAEMEAYYTEENTRAIMYGTTPP